MKCYALVPGNDGGICGAEATVLDLHRGFYVCPEHGRRAIAQDCTAQVRSAGIADGQSPMANSEKTEMPVAEFRRLIEMAGNELEIRRLVLYHQEQLSGTMKEICEALDFAGERAAYFMGPAEGVKLSADLGVRSAVEA